MLLERNVVGKKTDWANYITLSDEHETPMLRVLPKGPKPVNIVKHYQADTYTPPMQNAWPDGKDWDTFTSAGQNRRELTARCQWFVKTAAVSKLAEEVTDTAGIQDELAHEIPKKMTEMAREIECSAAGDQGEYVDDGKTGHKFRGVGVWIQSTAQTDAGTVVDPTIRPNTAQIVTTASTSLTEDMIKTALQSAWKATGTKGMKAGFVGTQLKKAFGMFQFYVPTTANTQATARIITRGEDSTILGNTVDVYDSDWGKIELHLTRWNAQPGFQAGAGGGTDAVMGDWRGYFLNTERWAWLWNQKPTVYKPEFKGGSYKAAIDAILMFLCWNPIGEMKVAPSDV
jgi:hypothetical protein